LRYDARVFLDFSKDRKSDLQCFTRGGAVEFRFCARRHAVDEGVELELQRLAGFDGELFEGNALRPADGERGGGLFGVVDRDVLARLEEAQFADLVGGNTAGGEIGDAAVFEFEAHVGDIDLRREDGDTGGADFLQRRAGEGEDDVEVVDHEVKYDVNIEAAQGEDAHAVHFEEERERGELFER